MKQYSSVPSSPFGVYLDVSGIIKILSGKILTPDCIEKGLYEVHMGP